MFEIDLSLRVKTSPSPVVEQRTHHAASSCSNEATEDASMNRLVESKDQTARLPKRRLDINNDKDIDTSYELKRTRFVIDKAASNTTVRDNNT
jgi:hypothetical protein